MANVARRQDGLTTAAITIRAHQLLGTVCRLAGEQCPVISAEEARAVLDRVRENPTVTIRLDSTADEVPHFRTPGPQDPILTDKDEILNRKRDLDVLQRLGLVPGGIRPARYLYTLLFDRIATPCGLCAHDTPGWEGCALAGGRAYESVRAQGWQGVVYVRPQAEKDECRRQCAERIANDERLFIRPHHVMCIACWYAGGEGGGPRLEDTIPEIHARMRRDPEVLITLVEGTCDVCDCCDGFHPPTGRCVHGGGLIRDYKKDLDVLQRLGLMPGATMKAYEFVELLFARIHSTTEICGYGDGVVTAPEWAVCGGPEGNDGYVKSRAAGLL